MDPFPTICAIILGWEGGFTNVASDPGNWTGGVVGAGRLVGTNFGISAASFPTLDIANLTRDQAIAIYRSLYWNKVHGPSMPPQLGLLVFDAAVNNGVGRAAMWLQAAVGTATDGQLGTGTMAALARALARPDGLTNVCGDFMTQRMTFMAALPLWRTFGAGWARRLCRLPFQSLPLMTLSQPAQEPLT